MTNWAASQLYFKNYDSTYLFMDDDDIIQLKGTHFGISTLYRVSINIICYDHDRKELKQHLPELLWNTTTIPIPPSGSLDQYWVFRKKEHYHMLDRDRRGLAKAYDDQEEMWNKMGIDHKYLCRIFTWFRHFVLLNTGIARYKKHYLKAVLNKLNPLYGKTIDECVDKIYENNFKNIEMGV